MADELTPRRAIKAILKGELPGRPLLMPILFSLGSRLENVTLREFLSNPTKIANALRQIRITLKVDGLACYFDRFLEAEALGCKLTWETDRPSGLACPRFSEVEELRQKLHSLDDLPRLGRIPVASEVLRRLKVILKDEPALIVSVTGPLTLARQLSTGSNSDLRQPLPELLEFAAEVTACVSRTFVEAGADLVLIVENRLSDLSIETCDAYTAFLDPIINIIRFYEALPVLLLNGSTLGENLRAAIFSRDWNCALCTSPSETNLANNVIQPIAFHGVALPANVFASGQESVEDSLDAAIRLMPGQSPICLTSSTDIQPTADLKYLAKVLDTIRSFFSQTAQSG